MTYSRVNVKHYKNDLKKSSKKSSKKTDQTNKKERLAPLRATEKVALFVAYYVKFPLYLIGTLFNFCLIFFTPTIDKAPKILKMIFKGESSLPHGASQKITYWNLYKEDTP